MRRHFSRIAGRRRYAHLQRCAVLSSCRHTPDVELIGTEALSRIKAMSRIDRISTNPSHCPRDRAIRLHTLLWITVECGDEGLHATATRFEPRAAHGCAQP